MNAITQFLETFASRDRDVERQREQNYIELIQFIKSELMIIHGYAECAELEELAK